MKSSRKSHTALSSQTKAPKAKRKRKAKVLTQSEKEDRDFRRWYRTNEAYVSGVLFSLLADFHAKIPFVYGCTDYAKDRAVLKSRLLNEGVSFAAKTLPTLSDGLLDHLEGRMPQYSGWKLDRRRKYPAFLRRLFAVAYDVKHKYHVDCVEFIYQFGVAFKKIKGPYRQSMLDQQEVEFCSTDMSLPDLPPEDSVDGQILWNARMVINAVTRNLDPDNDPYFSPNPGPGATNTPRGKHERYTPHVMYGQLDKVFPYEDWFYPNHQCVSVADALQGGFSHFLQMGRDMLANPSRVPTSRLKFVPKTFSKARSICIEENEMQYLQQGIKNGLVHRIETHPLTRGYVNFAEQTVNQKLALSASQDRNYATLDMKEASDRISRSLVSYLFQDNERLLECLMACSTTIINKQITFNGEKIVLPLINGVKKYAPMGSALCFPVMSLIHFAVMRGIMRYYETVLQLSKYSEPVYVYGDDLVVPHHTVGLLYRHMPKYGMKFNEAKSYHNGYFRESCGVHAYKGKDITPVYIKYSQSSRHVESILSGLAVEEQLYRKGLFHAADFVKTRIEEITGSLPYVSGDSCVLGFRRSLNAADISLQFWRHGGKFKHDAKYEKPPFTGGYDHQQMVGRFRVVVPLQEKEPPYPEVGGYLRRLTSHAYQHTSVKGQLLKHKIAWKWVAASDL